MNNEEYSRWLGGEKIEALLFRHNSSAEMTLPDDTVKVGSIVAACVAGPEPIYTLEADDGSGDIQCRESVLRLVNA